jgi:serine/threonine protein phosphatase PrpC
MREPFRLEVFGRTDVGRLRAHNEDFIDWDERFGLAIVADGMGGHNAGEVASRTAVRRIKAEIQRALGLWGGDLQAQGALPGLASLVQTVVEGANAEICEAGNSRPEHAGMGTTVVVALFTGQFVTVCHVGDSRLYRLRKDGLEQLTEDHSLVQQLVHEGYLTQDQARFSDYRNVITRALGAAPDVEPELQQQPTQAGDVYLLCSDGLSNVVTDGEIRGIIGALLEPSHGRLATAVDELVSLANERGGPDNISVVLVRLESGEASPHDDGARTERVERQ